MLKTNINKKNRFWLLHIDIGDPFDMKLKNYDNIGKLTYIKYLGVIALSRKRRLTAPSVSSQKVCKKTIASGQIPLNKLCDLTTLKC